MIFYLIQIFAYSTILLFGYNILIKKTKLFKERRFVLLLIPIFSLCIPVAKNIAPKQSEIISSTFYLNQVNISNLNQAGKNINSYFSLNSLDYFLIIYLLIVFVLTIIFFLKIRKVILLKKTALKQGNVYYTMQKHSPFSLFSSVFISNYSKNSQDEKIIILHEKAHISQYHSFDIIFLEIINIIFWYNPVFHFIKKEIAVVHEYLADETVLRNGVDVKKYSDILLRFMYLEPMAIANNLNNSLIKNRFIMMTQSKNKKNLTIRLSGITVLLILVFVFNNCINHDNTNIKNKSLDTTSQLTNDRIVQFSEIENKPQFIGGQDSLLRYIAYKTTYPAISKNAGIEATIFIKFIIAKDGNITQVDTLKVSTEADKTSETYLLLQNEAIRVISDMPKWTPGSIDGEKVKVKYVIPIKFKL